MTLVKMDKSQGSSATYRNPELRCHGSRDGSRDPELPTDGSRVTTGPPPLSLACYPEESRDRAAIPGKPKINVPGCLAQKDKTTKPGGLQLVRWGLTAGFNMLKRQGGEGNRTISEKCFATNLPNPGFDRQKLRVLPQPLGACPPSGPPSPAPPTVPLDLHLQLCPLPSLRYLAPSTPGFSSLVFLHSY